MGPCVAGVDTVDVTPSPGSWDTHAAGEAGWASAAWVCHVSPGLQPVVRAPWFRKEEQSHCPARRGHVSCVTAVTWRAAFFSNISSCGPVVRAWQTLCEEERGPDGCTRWRLRHRDVPVSSQRAAVTMAAWFPLVCFVNVGAVAQEDKTLW